MFLFHIALIVVLLSRVAKDHSNGLVMFLRDIILIDQFAVLVGWVALTDKLLGDNLDGFGFGCGSWWRGWWGSGCGVDWAVNWAGWWWGRSRFVNWLRWGWGGHIPGAAASSGAVADDGVVTTIASWVSSVPVWEK